MSFEWNHEQVAKLINLYREKPELWDRHDNNYHVKSKKNAAWNEMACEVGCEPFEAKCKMTSLLSSYRREKTREKRSIEETGFFVSSWFAYELFEFLKYKNAPNNNNNTNSEEVFDVDDLLLPDDGGQNTVHPKIEKIESPALSHDDNNDTHKRKILTVSKPSVKKTKRIEDRPVPAQPSNILDDDIARDESYTFGEYIVAKLRKFDDRHRTILMHRINNLIFDAEMELYSNAQPQYDDNSSASSHVLYSNTQPQYDENSASSLIS